MRESGRASGRLDRYRSDRGVSTAATGLPRIWRTRTIPHPRASQKKGTHGSRLGTHVRKSVVLACSIDCVARRVGAVDLGTAKFAGGASNVGGGHAAQRPLATGRPPPLAERQAPEAGMQCSGPLRRSGIVGQGGEEDGPQCAPCAGGRPAGRRNGGLRTAKGRRGGLGGSGVPARSRTRALQYPGQSALRRLQNVTPRNASRGTQKSSLRLGSGSYGSV